MDHVRNVGERRGVHFLEVRRVVDDRAFLQGSTVGKPKDASAVTHLAIVIDHFELLLVDVHHSSTDFHIELALLIGR